MLGVSEERFWDSTPVELEPYRKMDEMQQQRLDQQMWMMGAYVTNAVSVAVSNALNGKKSRAKYLSEPFMMSEKRERELTPEQELLRFQAWAVVYNENFKRSHGGQGK